MGKFMIKASYTAEGTKGLIREGGTSRMTAVEKMMKGLGGKLEAFYFAFGEADVFAVVDLPDNTSALATSFAINATGAVEVTTIPLLTNAEVDAACKKSIDYRAPGK